MPAFRPTATLTPAPSVATRVEFSYGASNRTACGGARLSCRGTGFAAAVSLFRWVSISGNCSLRCSRPPVPDAVYLVHPWTRTSSATVPDAALPPPSMESCIHAVVKGASNTVSRLKAAHITPSPFQGEGGDGGVMREHGHAHRHCTPTLALPLKGGGSEVCRLQVAHGVIRAFDDCMDAGGRATQGAVAEALNE